MSPRMRRSAGRRLGVVLVAAAVLLSGCGVRLDDPPPQVPSPGPGEILRQGAALEAADLQALAESAGADAGPDGAAGDLASDLAHIAADAATHLDDLGGVWTPPPRPTATTDDQPEPSDEPGDEPTGGDPTPSDPATAEDVLAALESSSADARAADPAADADLATLLASISINRALWAAELRTDLGLPTGADGSADPAAADLGIPASLPASAAPVGRTLDALGYTQEIIAARAEGTARTGAAAAAITLREMAEDVAVATGVDGTDADPRAAAYAVDLEDLQATRTGLIAELLPGWLTAVPDADPAVRAPLIALATQAAFLGQDPDARVATYPGLG
ncbi:hypothetical protein EXU48_23735 [Occultella glacieicola]|uniref:DUF4439 domain-containing protein n=1 Tax=Occultella glacieicola TaxID=2518684 RepID=A0ABY2DWZ6_9MICO|nr:hypothetical protein [Occultella glacieicola]TDE88299.1 hypothetical protein EXU48_23735 [Occultella glacieicola]